jgi:hypothetical protein
MQHTHITYVQVVFDADRFVKGKATHYRKIMTIAVPLGRAGEARLRRPS